MISVKKSPFWFCTILLEVPRVPTLAQSCFSGLDHVTRALNLCLAPVVFQNAGTELLTSRETHA